MGNPDTYTREQIVRELRKSMIVDVTPADIERIRNACKQHTPSPEGYMQWHAWAARMNRTHRQIKCEGCGLWAIWTPKSKRIAAFKERKVGK